MTTQQELLLRAISAFAINGIAQFTTTSLLDVCSTDKIKDLYQTLKADKLIQDLTVNGFGLKCQLQEMECPDFIFNPDLSLRLKCRFLEIWHTKDNPEHIDSYHPFYEILRQHSKDGWTYDKICQASSIKKVFTSNSHYKITDNGIVVYGITNTIKDPHCECCGETDPNRFTHKKSICDTCFENSIDNVVRKLYQNSKHNSKNYYPETYNLTPSFIKELYNKQEGKCAYSGEELQC